MPIRAGDVIERAQIVLNDNDPAFVRWPKTEMLDWLNDGASDTVILRPAAGAITETIELDAGTLQSIPAGGLELLDIPRNIKPNDTPGRSVTLTSRDELDRLDPNWHAGTPRDTLRHYTFDERTPDRFYAYPPLIAGVKAEIVYSKAPPLVADLEDMLQLDRAYMGALVSYLVFRASSKDSEYADGALAIAHQQLFIATLTGQNQSTAVASPNAKAAADRAQ